jgi:hypothetical protein
MNHRSEERTSFGGDGFADRPSSVFHGAIDRVRVRDLASNYSLERFNFDEGRGSTTVGIKGAVVHTGHATWISGAPLSRRDVFWSRLETLCGHAYAGRATNGGPGDSTLARGPLILDVRDCTPTIIRGAFDAGDDRSRTWAITRTGAGLRLEEDRRRPDGSAEATSDVAGETRDSGTVSRQEFVAGASSERTIEIEPTRALTYSVARGGGAPLELVFDVTRVIASPPPPFAGRAASARPH